MDHVTSTEASLDGIELAQLASYRVQSRLFTLNAARDNAFGIPAGRTSSVADGFWLLSRL